MTQLFPGSLPEPHRKFLMSTLNVLDSDRRIVGLAAGGSYVTDQMDEFSDLDLVIAVESAAYEGVLKERHQIAGRFGPFLCGFTGEHVGEPRLLICLYEGNPPLHVDLKFVALRDAAKRIEDPVVIWERGGRFTRALEGSPSGYPVPNLQWIEDRFWIWVHYVTTKIGRGELFEALEGLSFLRMNVLGPLTLQKAGHRPVGVRRLEQLTPGNVPALEETVAAHDAADCVRALRSCVLLYRALRAGAPVLESRLSAENAAMQYLTDVEERCSQAKIA